MILHIASSSLFLATPFILLSSPGQFLSKFCVFPKPWSILFPFAGTFLAAMLPSCHVLSFPAQPPPTGYGPLILQSQLDIIFSRSFSVTFQVWINTFSESPHFPLYLLLLIIIACYMVSFASCKFYDGRNMFPVSKYLLSVHSMLNIWETGLKQMCKILCLPCTYMLGIYYQSCNGLALANKFIINERRSTINTNRIHAQGI